VTEALEQESELKRLRDENAEMKKRISDFSSTESAKKKLELKVEQMESKVRIMPLCNSATDAEVDNRWTT
jgi:homeobox protein cut-like